MANGESSSGFDSNRPKSRFSGSLPSSYVRLQGMTQMPRSGMTRRSGHDKSEDSHSDGDDDGGDGAGLMVSGDAFNETNFKA